MISAWFLRSAMVFALVGMSLGIHMGATHDFAMAPVHAHINLLGFVAMFLAGLFYKAYPERETKLAAAHLLLAVAGLAMMAPGVAAATRGVAGGETLAIAGSLATLAATAIFCVNVFVATRTARTGRAAAADALS